MIASHLAGLVALLAVLLLWVAVQVAWRRTFPDVSGDADVLANRIGCSGCDQLETCAQPAPSPDRPMGPRRNAHE